MYVSRTSTPSFCARICLSDMKSVSGRRFQSEQLKSIKPLVSSGVTAASKTVGLNGWLDSFVRVERQIKNPS